MKSEPMTIAVNFDLTLETEVGTDYRQIGEEDYGSTPVTLLDAIIDRAATQLMRGLMTDEKRGGTVTAAIRKRATSLIDARLEPMIEDAFSKGIPLTSQYGEPTGKTTTMRELVLAEIGKHLRRSPNARYDSDKTTFDKILDSTTAAVVAKDLAAEVAAAKASVRKAVAASAAEVMAAAIMDGVTARG